MSEDDDRIFIVDEETATLILKDRFKVENEVLIYTRSE